MIKLPSRLHVPQGVVIEAALLHLTHGFQSGGAHL